MGMVLIVILHSKLSLNPLVVSKLSIKGMICFSSLSSLFVFGILLSIKIFLSFFLTFSITETNSEYSSIISSFSNLFSF